MRKSLVATALAVLATSLPLSATTAASAASTSRCSAPTTGYGRMFPSLSSASWDVSALTSLGTASIAAAETNPTPEGEVDTEDNRDIPAGYTYFGQFVDHDLTLDDRPNDLVTPTAVSSLVNGRTPQLDLDSLYGSGPTASSTLYETDGVHLKVGAALSGSSDSAARDLPRDATGKAIIGDSRNDENRIVAGVHSLFIRLHNQTVDRIRASEPNLSSTALFARARQEVTWEYQWLIVTDYLPKIAGQQTVNSVISRSSNGWNTNLRFYSACQQMPVEFSVAAYRFGHSMVRGLYRINDSVDRLPVFSGTFVPASDLTGFSPSPSNFAIDWKFLVPSSTSGLGQAQPSYKIDGSLTNSLSLLPLPTTGIGPANLATRNLLRGQQIGLPSGQDVARAMGLTPLRDDQILVGKASGDAADAVAITSVSSAFAGKAPLWSYVLAESVASAYPISGGTITGPQKAPLRLGPVGGRIVTETIAGLLASDPTSIVNHREFSPKAPGGPAGVFDLQTLVSVVTRPTTVTPPTSVPRPPATTRPSTTTTTRPPATRPAPRPPTVSTPPLARPRT
ncbi:unannotated protein [freshwater metagenome]|uniref:Unannotated protein n=1 Tax=freshwater metagenome TaxID=449393 RepID=A0A6J6HWM6_9ZZZZ|nr:hypothetical protein [Actinomycetota bacterium]